MRGKFIVIEGSDGSGKSTFLERLKKEFEERGIPYRATREPGGTPIGEKLREILLNPENKEMSHRAEALLYAAARAQHVEEVIRPTLEKGIHVLCDRFLISSIAYQGYGRKLGREAIENINAFAMAGLVPDRTLLFLLDPEESLKRKGKSLDRLERESEEFYNRVYMGYKESLQGEDIIYIDAAQDRETVYRQGSHAIIDWLKEEGTL